MSTQAADLLRTWFLEQALPLWNCYGVDHKDGGFYEELDHTKSAIIKPRRTRLVSRQIYMFAVGGQLGWSGPVDDLVDHGFRFLQDHLIHPEGLVYASCDSNGSLVDERQNLYDVAFLLLALAKHAQRDPGCAKPESLARSITKRLIAHPLGGYVDCITPELQCANPHMHLFESFLAWSTVQQADQYFWMEQATSLAKLALNRLISPKTGLLPEYFDRGWEPLNWCDGQRIEPGHQFEWSWLLARWSLLAGNEAAGNAAARLCSVAENHGVDHTRNVAIEAINVQLLPSDKTARLWQQTERLKAWHLQWLLTNSPDSYKYREHGLTSLLRFISGPTPGLWFDEMDPAGLFVSQPVKASSGYHLACAIEMLSVNSLSY